MIQMYALTGSPGAKPQPSFAGRGHSIAKRSRGPACEPSVQPGETFLGVGAEAGAGRGSLRSYPRPGQLPCWISTPSTMGQELLVSAMLGNPLLHSFGDMFSPCWRTSLLCHEECLHSFPTLYLRDPTSHCSPYGGSLPLLLPLPGILLPHIRSVHSLTSEVELKCPLYSALDCLLP